MSQLQKDVKELVNIAVRLRNTLDRKQYNNAFLSLKSAIKTFHQAVFIDEIDNLIDVFGGNNPKRRIKQAEKLSDDVEEPKKKGMFGL